MSNFLKIMIISVIGALANVALTRVGYINLIWIFVVVLLMTENDVLAIPVAILGGFLFDVMIHNSVGTTSLAILIGVLVFLLARAALSGDNIIFQIFSIVLLFIGAFSSEAVISILTEGTKYSSVADFLYWWKYVISHSVLVWLFTSALGGIRGVINSEKKIRIK
ncbi:MAG: hypothetical protein ABIC57_02240 [bacterium]